MKRRILVAIPIIIIVALALIMQSFVLAAFAITLAIFTQIEMVRAVSGDKKIIKSVVYLFAILCSAVFVWAYWTISKESPADSSARISTLIPNIYFIIFVLFILLAFVGAIFSKKHDMQSLLNTIFTMCYPQLFFVFMFCGIITYISSYYVMLVMLLMIFALPMLSDTLAYFIGKTFGKKKLCPDISPNKTVVGSAAGIAGGMICAFLIWILFAKDYNLVSVLILGGVLAVVSQIGDLAASFIKRAMNIKDFGSLLPGHGGILDRLDSILFCMPIVYVAFTM